MDLSTPNGPVPDYGKPLEVVIREQDARIESLEEKVGVLEEKHAELVDMVSQFVDAVTQGFSNLHGHAE